MYRVVSGGSATCNEGSGHSVNTFAFSQAKAHPRWGRHHVAEVEAFYLCWFEDHERPGFRNGEAFRIDPLGGKKCPLEGNAGPLNEQ